VCVVCCVGSGLCDGLVARSEEGHHLCKSVCRLETSTMRGDLDPSRAVVPQKKECMELWRHSRICLYRVYSLFVIFSLSVSTGCPTRY
jgi:hypothetical protein